MRVEWSPLALDRVIDIAEYIGQTSKSAARKWIDGLFRATKPLETFPQLGRRVPELQRKNIREIRYSTYRIIYRIEALQIGILTVRHIKQLLSEEDLEKEK